MQPSAEDTLAAVLQGMIKRGTQSAEEYNAAGRADLADNELREVMWLREYLPPQMTAEELDAVAVAVVAELRASSQKDMGRVIGAVMKKVGSAASGSDVSAAVKRALS